MAPDADGKVASRRFEPLLSHPWRARRLFDGIAPLYDRINALLYKPEWLREVRSRLRGPRVLDVGVGTGHTTDHLDGAVGIDLSREMLRRARYRGTLLRADILRPPFRPESFDTIVLAGSFYYLPDPRTTMRAIANLLRSGGTVVMLSPATRLLAPFVWIPSPEEYEQFLHEAGMHLEAYERLGRVACLVVGRKTA